MTHTVTLLLQVGAQQQYKPTWLSIKWLYQMQTHHYVRLLCP